MLAYYELPAEDQPPREIWHSSDRLKEWFDSVKQRREDKARGLEPIDDGPADDMTENAEAERLKKEWGLT